MKKSEIRQEVPGVEECYPVNLMRVVLSTDDDTIDSPWNYDILGFQKLITELSDREQRVIELRYRFGMTLEGAGKEMQVTRERIRQVEIRAIRKLSYNIHRFQKPDQVEMHDYEELLRENQVLRSAFDNLVGVIHDVYPQILEKVKEAQRKAEADVVENKHIEELELSVRSYNCLIRAGLNTVGKVIEFDRNPKTSWLNVRNLGRKSIEEIRVRLFEFAGYEMEGV